MTQLAAVEGSGQGRIALPVQQNPRVGEFSYGKMEIEELAENPERFRIQHPTSKIHH